jgi:hypothetical protein
LQRLGAVTRETQPCIVNRPSPNTIEQLNSALLGKLGEDKLLRMRKLQADTTVVLVAA